MYYFVYGLLWLLSLLPLRALYVIGDFFYALIFYVFKYRRDIVFANLAIAFPEKSEKERRLIARKFYHNMVDTFIETIKMVSASGNFLSKRVKGNWDYINNLQAEGRSIQIHLGHNFNWEWANAVGAAHFTIPFVAVYMPLASKTMDKIFYKLRAANGTQLVRATHMQRDFLPYRNKQYILGLAADQRPGHPGAGWWFHFLGRPAPFVKGPARAAINNNTRVIFAFIHKKKRGYYEVIFSHHINDTTCMTEQELTGKFVHYLEEVIKQYPDMWLWSHRRWKHEWKPEYGPIIPFDEAKQQSNSLSSQPHF
jgi:Kdo2-lipid IVA lauroyltransferase/acyltransferase